VELWFDWKFLVSRFLLSLLRNRNCARDYSVFTPPCSLNNATIEFIEFITTILFINILAVVEALCDTCFNFSSIVVFLSFFLSLSFATVFWEEENNNEVEEERSTRRGR